MSEYLSRGGFGAEIEVNGSIEEVRVYKVNPDSIYYIEPSKSYRPYSNYAYSTSYDRFRTINIIGGRRVLMSNYDTISFSVDFDGVNCINSSEVEAIKEDFFERITVSFNALEKRLMSRQELLTQMANEDSMILMEYPKFPYRDFEEYLEFNTRGSRKHYDLIVSFYNNLKKEAGND